MIFTQHRGHCLQLAHSDGLCQILFRLVTLESIQALTPTCSASFKRFPSLK